MSNVNDARPLGIEGLVDPVEVGRGGYGVVYAATETETGQMVAVKILSAVADHRQQARFEAECRAMQTLSHLPHVAHVDRWGRTDDDRPYLVMEYLPGGSLADRLRVGGPLLPERVRILGEQIAMALSAAHRVGIIHRDVKPENVLLDAEGQAKLTDFGIAVVTGMTAGTTTGTLVASFAHVAPELLDGARPSPLVDVYSLGSTLITLLTGEPPFQVEGESPSQMLARVLQGSIPDLRPHGVPDDLDGSIRRAMARDPAHRTPSAEQLAAELRGSAAPATGQAPVGPVAAAEPGVTSTPRRYRLRAAFVGVLGLLLVAVVVTLLVQHRSRPQPVARTTNSSVVVPTATAGSKLIDLRSVDWMNRSYPATCADDPAQVRNGRAVSNGMAVTVSKPVYGDISGDDQPEAVLRMDCVSATGGNQSASRAYVFAPGPHDPKFVQELADTPGGIGAEPDNISPYLAAVQQVSIADDTLSVVALAWSPNAPHCCNDLVVGTTWQLQNGHLTRTSRHINPAPSQTDGTSITTATTDPTPAPSPAQTCSTGPNGYDCNQPDQRLRADAGNVNIRDEPNTSSALVGTATGGQTVQAICIATGETVPTASRRQDQWVKVDLGSEVLGWIHASVFDDTSNIAGCD
jgi:hypothetical protein